MIKLTTSILVTSFSLVVTVAAHPGHPGHEDWPFEDFSWSMVVASAIVIAAGFTFAKRRVQRISRNPR